VKNYITMILGAAIAASPYFAPFIPAQYKPVAVAGLAFLTGLYHLYQEPGS